ncbi:MAG: hypothetical protein OXD43_05085 [Bacteroidetes bacterium]|nr:hypothetical protein [Bacteroidota bacterium]
MEAPSEPQESYVERLWNNLADLEQILLKEDAKILVDTRSAFAKAMVLAAGNWLERRTRSVLEDFATSVSSQQTLVYFVRTGALDRKFHMLFDWNSGKVNSFLGKFGPDFKKNADQAIKENDSVLRASLDFMELVAERNELAHSSQLGKDEVQFTASQVRTKFYNAAGWVSWIGEFLVDGAVPSWNPPSVP